MITEVEVEDYQAIRRASVRLGWLTVVTGPSGSGKSALLRAIELAAFNARGTAFIRHGAKTCKVALGSQDENWAAAIHRGGRGADKYVLTWQEGSGPDGVNGAQFTKLEGKVPAEVAGRTCLTDINFAGQFDRPYLLTESGGQVARVLGELTNVTLVLDAAREAHRRKLETQRELKQAEARLASLKAWAAGFRGLKDRMAAVQDARDRVDSMDFISDRHRTLDALWLRWRTAQQELEAAQARSQQAAPPSAVSLAELQARRERLLRLAGTWATAREDLENANDAVRNWQQVHTETEEKLHAALIGAGTCPTCGQPVTGLWRDFRVSGTLSSRSAGRSSSLRGWH